MLSELLRENITGRAFINKFVKNKVPLVSVVMANFRQFGVE